MDAAGSKRSLDQTTECSQPASQASQGPPAKANKRSDTQAASQRHIKTEQARRDKISAGFTALQDLLPGREKVEKAMLLSQAVDYIQQLQGVLQTLMSSGLVSQLPDNLQWQIRTLLPRKDGRPLQVAPARAAADLPVPGAGALGLQIPAPLAFNNLQMPPAPLPVQTVVAGGEKEAGKEGESALLAQVQALLQQQQQQVVAAQQIQTWQQTLQALQLQQVLQQGQQNLPDLVNGLCNMNSGPSPFASLPLQMPQAPAPMAGRTGSINSGPPLAKNPADCFVNELPRCGLQQLVDVAVCQQQSEPATRSAPSPHKARKNNVKVRRHTTAARIPKPADPTPVSRPSPGRPEPV